MINVAGLGLTFGAGEQAHQALRDIHFAVEKGEAFGLVGESGCGKSTILRCLAGLYEHWHGTIEIDGAAVGPKLDRARCRRVQMVFQDPYGSLHPRHTIETVLAEPLKIHRLGDVDDRVDQALASVGLDTSFRQRFPHQLSGGQRQRVAIARSLMLEPQVLLLDEPTAALDVSVQAEILNLLADLRRTRGLTYVLVTHDLGVVVHLCDRLAVMRQGEIVDTLPAQRLLDGAARHPYTTTLVQASLQHC
ncbi:ABC transporter ATP-binding protein [Pandoraea terrae]|nr:ABC transporter ATP-binding protein [Pandoraea terrae]